MRGLQSVGNVADRRGITLIEVIVVIAICGLLASLLVPAVQVARGAARRTKCSSNMRQIAVACHSYCDVYRVFPGSVFSGWHVPLKSFLEIPEEAKGAAVFSCPADGLSLGIWNLHQQSYYGNGGLDNKGATGFFAPHGKWVAPGDVTDGLSNTAAFAERVAFPPMVEVYEMDLENPSERMRRLLMYYTAEARESLDDFATECETSPVDYFRGLNMQSYYTHVLPPNRISCENGPYPLPGPYAISPLSEHPDGVNVAFGDGSIKFIHDSIDRHVWWALGTRNGGETQSNGFH
jgi:prepilin-type N-terminal cleavage/methylation domain-containing protein/prepilin-type processing-associated H-X9-DG protein